MPRDFRQSFEDILEAANKLRHYYSLLKGAEHNIDQDMAYDAIIRNLEIIGEAVKNVPESVWEKYPAVDWKGFAGLRDVLIHRYFGLTERIIWNIVEHELPILEGQINQILNDLKP